MNTPPATAVQVARATVAAASTAATEATATSTTSAAALGHQSAAGGQVGRVVLVAAVPIGNPDSYSGLWTADSPLYEIVLSPLYEIVLSPLWTADSPYLQASPLCRQCVYSRQCLGAVAYATPSYY